MNNMVKFSVTDTEIALVDDIQSIGHGEIYDVAFKTGTPHGEMIIDKSFATLIRMLKNGTKFGTITIHDSLPYIGHLEGKTNSGYRYLQKVKF